MARVPGRTAAGCRDDGPIKAKQTSRADEQSLLVHAGGDYSTFSSSSSSSTSPPQPQHTMIKKDKDSVDVYEHDAHTAHHDVDVEDGKAVGPSGVVTTDAVFGDITKEGPNYRGVSAWGAFILITKANLGLGILAIPFVFMSVGLVPGIILLCAVTLLMICKWSPAARADKQTRAPSSDHSSSVTRKSTRTPTLAASSSAVGAARSSASSSRSTLSS